MKRYYCTYFDRNYLVKAVALIDSLNRHERRDFLLFVVCLDEITRVILNDLALPNVVTVPLHEIERGDSRLLATKLERTLVEYYWTLTPTIILRLLERYSHLESLVYLDADLFFFSSPDPIFSEFEGHSTLIHEHRFSPDLQHLEEGNGRYNVGLLGFRNDSAGVVSLRWWRERCLEWCYHRSEEGKMGDQMYLNDWPDRFPGVCVLRHLGAGVAPWNHSQYHFARNSAGGTTVDGYTLVFYHFQSFTHLTPSVVIPARHTDYPLTGPILKCCFVPYLDALKNAIAAVHNIVPDFRFGLFDDVPLSEDHTLIAGKDMRKQLAEVNFPQQLFELDGEWDCYPSRQLQRSRPLEKPEASDLLWKPDRPIISEDDLLKMLADLPVKKVIRTLYIIGAHLFQERELVNRLFPNLRRIYLFEPIPELFQHLQKTTADDRRIQVFPYAIADRNEAAGFNITNNHASSSLLHLGKHLEIFPHVSEVGTIAVECRTLETVIDDHGLAEPDMLFIDVQGAEYRVLSALSKKIRSRVKLIYTEASTEELYLGSRPLGELESLLNPEFSFAGFAPLTNDTPTHGNALFVNRKVLHLVKADDKETGPLLQPETGEYLVSAIVSTYNAERFIRGKLEDLEAQTIADQIEIIVIDSGSLENERAVVEEFQRRYANIRYIRTEQRETVYQAWNRGIRAATGRFLTNANTDDRLRRDAIEVMVNALLANTDKVIAYGDSIVTLVPHETFDRCTPHDYLRWPDFDRGKLLEFCYIGPHPVWRREVHDSMGYFDERYRCAADYEFWLRLATKWEFIHVPELLGLYWQNEGTVSRKGDLPIHEAVEIQQAYRKLFAESIPQKKYLTFPPSPLANKYCTGKGLEIGGSAHNPFGLDTLNVDVFDSMETIYKQEEIRVCGRAMPVDIVAPGDEIPLPDGSQDFIVSSHVLEHFPNPVKALLEWDRLVRPGGIIFMIVPHKERTFDSVQNRTTLQHLIEDYNNNATEPHKDAQGHDHCWITDDIVQLCLWMIRELGVKWDIVEVRDVDDKVGNGFTIVIRKTGERHHAEASLQHIPEASGRSVLYVVHGFPPDAVGGVEVYTRNLALEMAAKGNRMTVLYPVTDPSGHAYTFSSYYCDGIRLVKFHVPQGHLFTSMVSDEIDGAFAAFLRDNSFDLIHFHHLFDNLSMSMITVAKGSAVPVAVTLHDFWFICPRAQLYIENNGSVCSGPETPGKCADCIVLAGWFPGIDRKEIEPFIALRHEYVRRILSEADLVFAPSRFVADTFERYNFGEGRIRVAPLGVGRIAMQRQKRSGAPRFCYMGTIHPVKNVLPLVRAFASSHGEATLHLYGGGEARRTEELKNSITDPRISYHGSYTPAQLPEILAGVDVLVVPSLVESYCLTVREALSVGIPVLAARVGGIPEIVRDRVNGLLFNPSDSAELTRLIQQIINDPSSLGNLNGSALPVTTIADDARFLLGRYDGVISGTVLQIQGNAPAIVGATTGTSIFPERNAPSGGEKRKLKVAVYSMDNRQHACGHYRIKAPLEAFADKVEIIWGIRINEKDNAFTINTEGLEEADLIITQRFLPRSDTKGFLDYLCSLGKPVIFEIDDLLTQLPETNPNHLWGMKGAVHIHEFMKRCAAVTVSTEELRSRFLPFNDNIYVLPNMLDSGLWTKPSPPSEGPVVIGYAGTNTHGADLELLEEVLERISRRYGSGVAFTFMGCATERISRLPGFRYVQFETTFEEYAKKLMDTPMDIVLAPLEDNPFNRCKSNVKWLEYSACGIAGVYSDLPPYACVKSGETGILAKNRVEEWYDAISYLIDNPGKRREIARNARNEVMTGHTVAARAHRFLDTYRNIIGVQRPAGRDIRLSIIIMTWNRAEMLDQCLSSLFANLSDPDSCEIIVGNNGSTDRTEEVIGHYRIDKYVKKENKIGLEFYRELFDMAEGEYIIDLDDDVIDLPKDFDRVFIDFFKEYQDYGFLGLDVVRNRFTNGAKPEESEYSEDARNGRTVQEGRVIGCCACIGKDTFEKIGGFTGSDLSMAYVEDGILTQRVQALGMRTGIIKDVKCFHACGPYYSAAYGYLDRDIEKYEMAGLSKFAGTYRPFKENRNMEGSPMISIIIPLYNKAEYTRKCLEALAVNTPGVLNYEVIFVDNGSSDGTSEYLRSLSGDVTIITNLKNLGFARACNQGGRLATGDYLVFLNNDTIPKPGWLEALIDGIERDGADICGSRLLYPDGRVQHAGVAFNEQGIGYHIFKGLDGNDPAVTGKRLMQCVTGACMAISRELFLEMKGFDEGYLNGFEDVDLCLRAGVMGKKILYVPDSKLVHFEETSDGRKSHDEQNARRFMGRWGGKVRCDDNYFYQQEGYGKEMTADGMIRIFKQEKPQPRPSGGTLNPDAMERRLERADSLVREGKFDDAIATYWSVLRADKNNPRAMTGIGVVRLMTGELKEAEASFNDALAVNPADAKAMSGLGMVRRAQGKDQEAFGCFSSALDSDPENLTALSELLQASYRLNRFTEAEQRLEAYLRYHPADLNMLFSLAGVQMKMGKNDDALEKLDKVLLFDPGFEGALEMQRAIAGHLRIAV